MFRVEGLGCSILFKVGVWGLVFMVEGLGCSVRFEVSV